MEHLDAEEVSICWNDGSGFVEMQACIKQHLLKNLYYKPFSLR